MKSPTTHREWMILIENFHEDSERKWVNETLDFIYPDFEKFSTIHRTKCEICNGNIIKFDEVLHHKLNSADISAQTYEFHNKNCVRKKKLLKIKEINDNSDDRKRNI